MKKRNLISLFAIISILAIACSDGASNQSTETDASNAMQESEEVEKEMAMPSESEFELNLIIANNISAPVKLLTDMNKAGLQNFNAEVLNPTSNASNYATAQQKALAYGVYGADFSYIAIYKKNEMIADYLILISQMSEELGMADLFNTETMTRFDRIKENPDSVKMFIFDKYDEADGFLRDNDRMVLASLILTGGLIESLHLVSDQIESGEASKDAYTLFLEQKNTLKSLIDLYASIEADGESIPVKADIESLYSKFQEVDSYEVFSEENITPLHKAIDEVRASIL